MRDDLCGVLVPRGRGLAERAWSRKLSLRTFSFPEFQMSIRPTRLGNVQEAQRDYIARSYGIDVTIFWPSLQKVATADERFADLLENAKTRLDFSVAITAAAALFTLGWIALYSVTGSSVLLYSEVAIAAAAIALIFRQVVLINYVSFSETVRTAVELFRFDLLNAMHVKLPTDSAEEQATWNSVAQRLQFGTNRVVQYAPGAPSNHA